MCAADAPQIPALPQRDSQGHKGTFGTVCVVGGCAAPPKPMVGAPAFAALAALRTGCGLAVIAAPEPVLVSALTIAPGATGLALSVDAEGNLQASDCAALLAAARGSIQCMVIGPGLGSGYSQQQLVIHLVSQDDLPMVIDADAINALAATPSFQLDFRAPCVLTPHPGEFRRLAASLNMECDPVDDATREQAACSMAQRLGCVLLLKGARTVVSDGDRTWSARLGNASLATAGSGDVLSGIIGSLIAQFYPRGLSRQHLDLFACAQLAAHIHGLAADAWAAKHGEAGLIASELCAEIPDVLQRLRGA